MALAPWGALGGGHFKTDAQRAATKEDGRNFIPATEHILSVSKALEAMANRKNTAITSIALAYVMQKTPYVFPIVGGRTVEHLKSNVEALSLELSKEDIEEIEKASPIDLGFPHSMVGLGPINFMNSIGGSCDYVEPQKVCFLTPLCSKNTDVMTSGNCSSQAIIAVLTPVLKAMPSFVVGSPVFPMYLQRSSSSNGNFHLLSQLICASKALTGGYTFAFSFGQNFLCFFVYFASSLLVANNLALRPPWT